MSKWKMVPLEPTDEMIHAIDGLICSSYLWPVYAYRAMIDAAPVQQTDPLGYFTFNKEWNVWEQMSAKYKNASDATPLYLHPPSAELARLRAENERLRADAAPCVPKMTDAEMVRTESWQSITDELAHAAYLRGIEEGKRQGLAPQDRSAPALHTCGSCTWWNPRSADKRTGSCEFQVVTPASSPYPIDRTPMHETEGDDCRCFERKEG